MEEVKRLKPGTYVLHKSEPYRVVKNQIVVTGTHSHTKVKLELQNIFSGGTENLTLPPHDRMEPIDIVRKKGQVISKGTAIQIMDPVSYETLDAEAEKELFEMINPGDEITFIDFNNRAVILEKRC